MLTPFDDYPFHQLPTTFDNAGTSDYRFFDRYWFAIYDPAGRAMLASGLGVYKNMNVLDGFGSAVLGDSQRNVRVSRTLRPHLGEIGAGPLRYEIIEGLKKFRLILEPNAFDLAFDVTWEGDFPAFEEKPHFQREAGMAIQDYMRVYQYGHAGGEIATGGEHIRFDDWFAFRDRSWGVRAGVGGPAPVRSTGAEAGLGGRSTTIIGFAFATEDYCSNFSVLEASDGARMYEDGVLVDRAGKQMKFTRIDHDLEFEPGTLILSRARCRLVDQSGKEHEFTAEPISKPFVYQGYGYFDGYRDRRGLGCFRGDLVIEGETYDLGNPEKVIDHSGVREFPQTLPLEYPVRITFDGKPGMADSMVSILGPHPRYKR